MSLHSNGQKPSHIWYNARYKFWYNLVQWTIVFLELSFIYRSFSYEVLTLVIVFVSVNIHNTVGLIQIFQCLLKKLKDVFLLEPTRYSAYKPIQFSHVMLQLTYVRCWGSERRQSHLLSVWWLLRRIRCVMSLLPSLYALWLMITPVR